MEPAIRLPLASRPKETAAARRGMAGGSKLLGEEIAGDDADDHRQRSVDRSSGEPNTFDV
ncbi:MAG: hypothetical protein DMG40_11725 [Acidobacteria bacterium]|nr:MAG: hypothetical protein DMG40_11725 [Acidobacteriota bacterium]